MEKTFVLDNAKRGFEFMEQVESIGKELRLKKFSNLPSQEKQEIFAEALTRQLFRLCTAGNKFPGFIFRLEGKSIKVIRKVLVEITGNDQLDQPREKNIFIETVLFSVKTSQILENTLVEYSFELHPDGYDEAVLFDRVKSERSKDLTAFKTMNLQVSEEDKAFLNLEENLAFLLQKMPKKFKWEASNSTLLVDFIDVLNVHQITDAKGIEVLKMRHCFNSAIELYPLLAKKTFDEQMNFLDDAYTRACRIEDDDINRDVHFFAKATFEEMANQDLHKEIKIGKRFYTSVAEYRHDIYLKGKCIAKDELKMVRYAYNQAGPVLYTCFCPRDLWHFMVLGDCSVA